jgi:hypothetical protein
VVAFIVNQIPAERVQTLIQELKDQAAHISALLYPQD